jgi:RNA polymerase sigma-70 factor (ECF subfamily)
LKPKVRLSKAFALSVRAARLRIYHKKEQSMMQRNSITNPPTKLNHRLNESLAASAPSDEQLIQLCLSGVREAFDELVLRYRSLAYGVAFRRLGNAADASDAVQQGFTNAYTRLHTFQGQSAFKTWLRTVVRNAAVTLGRKTSCRRANFANFAATRPTKESRAPLDDLIANERREFALRFLEDHVTIRSRLIYKLRIEEGLTYREIAQMVKWTDARKARYLIVEKLLPAMLDHLAQ